MADNELFPGTGGQGKRKTDEHFCSIVRITDVFLKYLYTCPDSLPFLPFFFFVLQYSLWLTNECEASTQKALWAGFMLHVSEWSILALEEVALPQQSQYAIRHKDKKKQKKWRNVPYLRCTLNVALVKNSSQHALTENQWHLWIACLYFSMFRSHGRKTHFMCLEYNSFALGNFGQMALYHDRSLEN